MALTRTTLGRLAAHEETPTPGVSTAFSAADWTALGAGISISVVAGSLRSAATFTATTREIRYTALAARQDALAQMIYAATDSQPQRSSLVGRSSGAAVSALILTRVPNSVASGSNRDLRIQEIGSSPQTLNSGTYTPSLPQRHALALVGTEATAYWFTQDVEATLPNPIALPTAGAFGVAHGHDAGSGAQTMEWSAFFLCSGRYLVVSGLPTGAVVRVRSAGATVLASATESGGTATVDMLRVPFPLAVELQVLDGAMNVLESATPSETLWAGDSWTYAPPPPGTPSGLGASAPTESTLAVAWDAVADADYYDVDRSLDGTTGWTPVYSGTGTGFTDTGLSASTAYYYRVRACNDSGCSAWSDAATGTTDVPLPFLRIAGITVPVSPRDATVLAPERLGGSARMFEGGLRTTVRIEKRGWRFRTPLRPVADWTALEAAVAAGAFVSCAGHAIGDTVTCEVTISASELVPVAGGFRKSLTLTLREV